MPTDSIVIPKNTQAMGYLVDQTPPPRVNPQNTNPLPAPDSPPAVLNGSLPYNHPLRVIDVDAMNSLTQSQISTEMLNILIMLVQLITSIRKASRDQWNAQAQKNLQIELSSVDKQRLAANQRLAGDLIQNAFSAVQGAAEAGIAGVSALRMNRAAAAAKAEAKNLDFGDKHLDVKKPASTTELEPSDKALKKATDVAEKQENIYAEIKDGKVVEQKSAAKLERERLAAAKKDSDKKAADAESKDKLDSAKKTPEEEAADQKIRDAAKTRRAEFLANRERSDNIRIDTQSRVFTSVAQIITSLGKMGGNVADQQAGLTSADAAALKAVADWMNNVNSVDSDYANELREQFKNLISVIEAANSASHQATVALWS